MTSRLEKSLYYLTKIRSNLIDNYIRSSDLQFIVRISNAEIIDCTDEKHSNKQWRDLIGQEIESIGIIKINDDEYENNMGMNERGIHFNFKFNEFIFPQTLVSKKLASTVLMKKADIADEYSDKLEFITTLT